MTVPGLPADARLPPAPFCKSGVTSPNRTTLNFLTSSTCFQKVDDLMGGTGTKSTRTRQDEVMFIAKSIHVINLVPERKDEYKESIAKCDTT